MPATVNNPLIATDYFITTIFELFPRERPRYQERLRFNTTDENKFL